MTKKVLLCILFFLVLGIYYPFCTQSAELEESFLVVKEEVQMEVKFYAIDREKMGKGEFLGIAKIQGGELIVNVTDPELEKILKNPYKTMQGEVKGGMAVDRAVTLQPGTIEHLKTIAVECWQFGYIGEIVEK